VLLEALDNYHKSDALLNPTRGGAVRNRCLCRREMWPHVVTKNITRQSLPHAVHGSLHQDAAGVSERKMTKSL